MTRESSSERGRKESASRTSQRRPIGSRDRPYNRRKASEVGILEKFPSDWQQDDQQRFSVHREVQGVEGVSTAASTRCSEFRLQNNQSRAWNHELCMVNLPKSEKLYLITETREDFKSELWQGLQGALVHGADEGSLHALGTAQLDWTLAAARHSGWSRSGCCSTVECALCLVNCFHEKLEQNDV